ncbi:MAG: hypothetical protein HC764_21060, partial [Pleurocapsa sp. CRU_1_2]|nr:hypothetical protein [Pleurocapsa sp. CRU_1_2]
MRDLVDYDQEISWVDREHLKTKMWHKSNPATTKLGERKTIYSNPRDEVILNKDHRGFFQIECEAQPNEASVWMTTIIDLDTDNSKQARKLKRKFTNPNVGLTVSLVSDEVKGIAVVTKWKVELLQTT